MHVAGPRRGEWPREGCRALSAGQLVTAEIVATRFDRRTGLTAAAASARASARQRFGIASQSVRAGPKTLSLDASPLVLVPLGIC